jgi:four helix bundle protein
MEDEEKIEKMKRSFEDLEVWQASRILVKETYKNFTDLKDFSFRDQITRAAVSIMNNIAEGHERSSEKEFARFSKIAKGSCGEVRSMIIIANDLNYISIEQKNDLIQKCYSISKQLAGFIKYLNSKNNF